MFATIFILNCEELKQSFFLPTRECLKGLTSYLLKALPSVFLSILDWWSLELMVFYATFISPEAIGA